MIPPGRERDDLHLRLGLKLYDMGMQDCSEDWILFSAADHLNSTSLQLENDDPTFLIKLNLEVAERASSVAAYQNATKYLGLARQSLSKMNNPWEEYYDLTLRVYEATVEVEFCLGNLEVVMAVGQTLLNRATSLDDKITTYVVICHTFGRREQHQEAYDMCIHILRMMGAIPKGDIGMKMKALKDFLNAKRFLSRHSDADILAIPLMKDKGHETILELLAEAAAHSHLCGSDVNYLSAMSLGLGISLTKGLSLYSGMGIMGYCLICNAMNDMKGAYRFSNIARKILEVTKAKEHACIQLFVGAAFSTRGRILQIRL